MDNGEEKPGYFIDLDWYQQRGRSFQVLAQARLCPSCREKIETESECSPADLIQTIRDCCSHKPGFITPNLPILEAIFRLFLAGDNQPLGLGQLQGQLKEWLGSSRALSLPRLKRLLDNDQYYGFGPAPLSEEETP